MVCLIIPLSVRVMIPEHSEDEKEVRDDVIYYWRNISPYSMIGWGQLGGQLHCLEQESTLRAANEYIERSPGSSMWVWHVYVLECSGWL